MTKRQENRKIDEISKKWGKIAEPSQDAVSVAMRYFKREIKRFTNYMMYRKRPTDKIERYADTFMWWFIIVIIYFALEGFTYKFTGR